MEHGEGERKAQQYIDPITEAFRAADNIAVPGTLLHMEVALNQLETQVETPLEKEVAISEVVKEEKRAALIRNAIIDVLEKSKSISPNEAVELRLGTASKELRDRARARVRSVMLHRRRRSPILPDHPLIKRPEQ